MRYVLSFLLGSFTFVSAAQDLVSANSAEEAMKLCQEKSSQSPKELQKHMLSSCSCTVKNTDFKQVKSLSEAGKKKELRELYQKAAKACLKK